jgi:hypothetical protein
LSSFESHEGPLEMIHPCSRSNAFRYSTHFVERYYK